MNNELTVMEQVEKALAFAETKAQVIALVADSATITAITNGAGYQQCHAARMVLKNTRIAIEKTGKEAREDAIKFQKGVIEKEKELVALIVPEEKRLGELQDAVDKAKEREKAAKEEAERQAKEAIRARFDAIKGLPLKAVGQSVEGIRELIEQAELADDEGFATEAERSAFGYERGIAIAALKAAMDRQIMADAEAERIKAERVELERLRAQAAVVEAERVRLEHVAREQAEAAERTARAEAEAAARAAREEEQARIDAERAERRRIEDAERAERERKDRIEREQIAAEKAELERQRTAQEHAAKMARIANASLHVAARAAVEFLTAKGYGKEEVTLALDSALDREHTKKAA